MASKPTIRTVKQRLVAAYPDVEFSYGIGGRGRYRGHAVSWVGGPLAVDVQAACEIPWQNPVRHFERKPTEAEWKIQLAQWETDDAARKAAEPARRAAAKADGLAKRKATLAAKRDTAAKLTAAFPDVAFTRADDRYGAQRLVWTDGPDDKTVCTAIGIDVWNCDRTESATHKAETTARNRTVRRLAASRARAARVAKGTICRRMARDRAAYMQASRDAQLTMWERLAA